MQELEKQIRQLMLDAEEEVPSRVWDAVAAGLDKAAAPKVVPLWRRVAVAVAAAAAVVLGIFLSLPREQSVPQFDRVIAEAVPEVLEPGLVRPQEIVPGNRYASVRSFASAVEEPATAVSPDEADQSSVGESSEAVRPSSVPSRSYSEETPSDETAFNELAFAESQSRQGGRLSVSAGGNVFTNNNPSSTRSRYMRTSGTPQTGITESESLFYGVPISVGIGVSYRFAPKWSVSTGLIYTNLTRTFAGSFIEVDKNSLSPTKTVSGEVTNVQHYLGVPLDFRYHFVENRSFHCYAFAGGTVERCLSDSYRIQAAENLLWKKDPRGVQFSAAAGFGVEFALTDHLALYADPSLRYWFDCGQSKSIRTQQPFMAGLELGLRFGW